MTHASNQSYDTLADAKDSCDTVVIGAGVIGLACAVRARAQALAANSTAEIALSYVAPSTRSMPKAQGV